MRLEGCLFPTPLLHAPLCCADVRNRVSLPFRHLAADPAPLSGVRASPSGRHLLLLFRCGAGRLATLRDSHLSSSLLRKQAASSPTYRPPTHQTTGVPPLRFGLWVQAPHPPACAKWISSSQLWSGWQPQEIAAAAVATAAVQGGPGPLRHGPQSARRPGACASCGAVGTVSLLSAVVPSWHCLPASAAPPGLPASPSCCLAATSFKWRLPRRGRQRSTCLLPLLTPALLPSFLPCSYAFEEAAAQEEPPEERLAFCLIDGRAGVLGVRGRRISDVRPRRPTWQALATGGA